MVPLVRDRAGVILVSLPSLATGTWQSQFWFNEMFQNGMRQAFRYIDSMWSMESIARNIACMPGADAEARYACDEINFHGDCS